ncbi:MAG: glycine-tRNA synthetase subunit beta [Alcanivorax borkumensis]|jgi:glycyl-tRNA synthetase beta chain|uniref:Glycine--tRNA ligase beta subunit n=1 Tax=Alcanivorax borkumensis (strain ATCC 700651 / DSM 11573 / NCIMB 13689 / SK2) TaxID=393595 RepID=Q0VT23_ALCBS|nr:MULTISPECIES: glycine--tRNA ligase subunit beta [Alcanivorax]OJH09058.1 MAG: glycine-tRNA synthetase subunit beta [Alcanivorax borkumensis]BAP12859.1 glycyl-tRNA synthetase [Alcanivorax sp. NBRC 101098]CAL15456.1 glycyl-tRNA synthetase [Alcanivorax borkumensis SK2]
MSRDLLIELGTEELPPKALASLSAALTDEFVRQLDEAGLNHGAVERFAAPRRLALLVRDLDEKQADRDIERQGPAVQAAFDSDGNPTKAAQGFAASLGLTVDQLGRQDTGKGERLVAQITEQGKSAAELIPAFFTQSIQKLPIPKRMRWGKRKVQFVRPAHWLVALFGDEVIPFELLDLQSGRTSYGHRFHAPGAIELASASEYAQRIENDGHVLADFDRRKAMIKEQTLAAGKEAGGVAQINPDLLNEVTALVEWPEALMGSFDDDFLRVPQEALISAMEEHQKYFSVLDNDGKLMPRFITISNIQSKDPQQVIHGNEKVIRPRLADAAFFYDNDCKRTLAQHAEGLTNVVFQQQLGTVAEKCERIGGLAAVIAENIGGDVDNAKLAGKLSKADLNSEMVGEFDTMQGIMGFYLAQREGQPKEVANALYEQYLPRFAGDTLPQSKTGMAVSLADKIDTLVGIFGIGQKPSGTKDPYALRRATLGVLRIIIEHELALDLRELLDKAAEQLGERIDTAQVDDAFEFIKGRYRAIYQEQGIATPVILSVLAIDDACRKPLDFDRRVKAVAAFQQRDEAQALAAANKRVSNILAKLETAPAEEIDGALLEDEAEKTLTNMVVAAFEQTYELLEAGDYASVLEMLAQLREPVDTFFDTVMVMAEDEAVRNNRLALLAFLRDLFLNVADISLLQE